MDWLTARSINVPPNSKCVDLRVLIKQNKPKSIYKTDVLAGEQGHSVPGFPFVIVNSSPIELVWANCNNYVARNNTFKMVDVKRLVNESFERITPEFWAKYDNHVLDNENNYWQNDLIEKSRVQPVIINLKTSDSRDDRDSDF